MRVWFEIRKRELEEETARQEKELAASFQRSREELARSAMSTYEHLVNAEETLRDRLEHLRQETLAEIVAKNIHKILPG
jgi:uncharacterized protein with gpF-like domain